jgi:aubergine-like protein
MAGRGQRLLENLKKIKGKEIGGTQEKSEDVPQTTPSATTSGTPSQPRTGGGRGRILQALSTITTRAESPPREPSPSISEGQPSPSGAVGSSSLQEPMEHLHITEEEELERRRFPAQPDPILNKARGTDGQVIPLALNYVLIKQTEGYGVFEYHVSFAPQIDSRGLRFKILHQKEVIEKIGSVMQFTGMNLYLPKLLENMAINTTTPTDGSPIKITLQFIKVPPFHELTPFYNTLFRRIMNDLKLVQIQRHHYDPTAKIDVPVHKLEIWPGYVTSIQDFDGGLLLNCDASHRILRTNTAKEVLQEIFKLPDGRTRFKEMAQKRLVGCVILTRYNNMPYRIDDISFDQNPMSTFNWNGREVTYVEYFKSSWEIDIKDLKQPLLIHRPKPKRGETVRNICFTFNPFIYLLFFSN